jgi:hypothetical protein
LTEACTKHGTARGQLCGRIGAAAAETAATAATQMLLCMLCVDCVHEAAAAIVRGMKKSAARCSAAGDELW